MTRRYAHPRAVPRPRRCAHAAAHALLRTRPSIPSGCAASPRPSAPLGRAKVYAIGGSGLLLASQDGGKTWSRDAEADSIPSNFYKIKFFKDESTGSYKGFILGSQGVLMRYTGVPANA